jgi:ABC-type transport system substrate-binding protein
MKKAIVKGIALTMATLLVLPMTACSGNTATADPSQSPSASGAESKGNVAVESVGGTENEEETVQILGLQEVEVDTSRKSTATSDEKKDKVIIPNDEVSDLLPYHNLYGSKNMICGELYEPLFDLTSDKELVGRIAKSYTEIDDTHVQVEIYDNVYDTDNNHITASDVVFSFDLTRDSGMGEDLSYYKSAKAINDYTVEFEWTEPITSMTAFNSMMNYVCIVSEKAYSDHDFTTDPVATGPYQVESYTQGVSVVLEINENYWQTDELRNEKARANVRELEFDVLADTSMQLVALESGTLVFCDITTQDVEKYASDDRYNVYSLPNTFNNNLIINQSAGSVGNDINFRLAVYYAIDNNVIAEALGSLTYYPCAVDASKVMSDYNTAWEQEENYNTVYDLELAKEYLAKSSYDGEELTIICTSMEANKNASVIILGCLEALGVKAKINAVEPPSINGVASDPEQWDLWFNAGTSSSGYCITRTAADFDPAMVSFGASKGFIDDDTFLEMLVAANSKDGYSVEATQAVYDYVIENAYDYGVVGNYKVYAFDPSIAHFTAYYNDSVFLFGACDYYLD